MTEVEISRLFSGFEGKKVMVIGDVMVDAYLWGTVDRISPEAPVPVVALRNRENRPGGAANVALNLQALGATPLLFSVIGKDHQGELFLDLMTRNGMSVSGLIASSERVTTTKFRIIGNKMQMLRVDEESLHDLSTREEDNLLKCITDSGRAEKPDALILQDYDKGVLSPEVIRRITEWAQQENIPVCVDPKKKHFMLYRNVSLFKPNLKELKEGLKQELSVQEQEKLVASVSAFQNAQNIDMMMVTLSEHGVMIRENTEDAPARFIPAHLRSITDVSGAGDTVISVAALCLASGCKAEDIASISNLAGGLVCEQTGVVPVEKERLFDELTRNLNP